MAQAGESLKDQKQREEDLHGYMLGMTADRGAMDGGLIAGGGAEIVGVLSDEEQAAIAMELEEEKKAKAERLDSLGSELSRIRREAIDFRKASGIELIWQECEDAYEGMDEASKNSRDTNRTRPIGTFTIKDEEDSLRSTVVLNVTKPYVNAFASKIIDMRLQITDRAWKLKPTPIPEMQDKESHGIPLAGADGGPLMVNDGGQQRAATMGDLARLRQEKADAKAELAQTQIDDWMIEGKFDKEARQAVDDMSRIGSGVVKGPYPEMVRRSRLVDGVLAIEEKIKPRSKRVAAENLYPDPACGEDIHAGDYIWERDNITTKRIEALKGVPGYIDSQIDAVIKEGPRLAEIDHDPALPIPADQKLRPFQIWFYHGKLSRSDLMAADCPCGEGEDDEKIPVIATMVNDRVICMALNPSDTGRFPYNVGKCSRRKGHWAGIGIAEELRTPQRIATGATRAMMENAGLSAKPIIAIMQGLLVPADGNAALYGGKIFIVPSNVDIREAKDAIFQFQIQSRQQENMNIIMFALKMCEDVTGLPMILQGQQGKAPDVLGVVQILNENATSVARRVAKMYDDDILEPHVGAYYDWMMSHGEDDSMKGDCTVQVLPAPDMNADKAALVEMMKLSQVPGSDVNPAKQYSEFAKAMRFDPKRIQYTEEEKKALQKQGAPADPRIAAAQIKAESDKQVLLAKQQHEEQMEQLRQRFEAAEAERDRQNELIKAAIDERMNSTQLTSEERQNLEKIKATLTSKVIEVRAQKELTRDAQVLDLHKHTQDRRDIIDKPAVEPAGRAPNGQAFTR